MKKLIGTLKPYRILILFITFLLFVQAMCDLELPNYMSKIVNVGIQQSGIENPSPSVVGQDSMAFMQYLMSAQERAAVENAYELGFDPDLDKNREPLEAGTGEKAQIYMRKRNITGSELITVNNAFANASQTLLILTSANDIDMSTFDHEALQELISTMPTEVLKQAQDIAFSIDSAQKEQVGIQVATLLYKEIGYDLTKTQSGYIKHIGLIMLLIALLGGVIAIIVSFFTSRIAAGVARKLRKRVFSKVMTFNNDEIDSFSTSSLIIRTTNDVQQIQMLFQFGIRMVLFSPMMAVGGVVMAINHAPSMSWIVGLAVACVIALMLIIFTILTPKFKIVQKLNDKINLVAREHLTGLMVIKAFGTTDFEKERYDKANKELTNTHLFVGKVMSFMGPIMTLLMSGVPLLITWVGASQIAEFKMQVGDMIAFLQYSMQIIMSFMFLAMMYMFIPRAVVASDRISEVLETTSSVNSPANPIDEIENADIEFYNVSYHYKGADENALTDINFIAEQGKTTAIVGATGSGKTTLVNLLMRFYDTIDGSIKIGGVDIRNMSLQKLHEKIGYIPQKGLLFSGTIASNIRYGAEDISDEAMAKAAEIAQATEFIETKENKFDEHIAQGGGNVSGGQKQRLSIARALAKNSPIYIFDDSFSALDFKTDAALRKALKDNLSEATILIIAQRISTIKHAEQIIMLDEGKIVGKGTHKELMANCPEYKEVAKSQGVNI